MHIVSCKAIRVFSKKHVAAQAALDRWFKIARKAAWANFADVRTCFNTADFDARVLFIHAVMRHKEYEKGAWTS